MKMPSFLAYIARFFFWCISIALIVGGLAFWYWNSQATSSRGSEQNQVAFTVGKGEGANAVAEHLEAAHLIESKLAFLYYVTRFGLQDKLQSGEYELSGTMTIADIAHHLADGKVIPPGIRITFPEGLTMSMLAERLNQHGLPGDDFLVIVSKPYPKWRERFGFLQSLPEGKSLEGFLFPDTYIFPRAATAELIVGELLKTFEKKAWPLFETYAGKTNLSFYQALILASIIEEEGKNAEERRVISDIFLKRIKIGQPLQSDATVNYALGTSKLQPTLQDTETDSLYNTYRYPGLPPTPIANPGTESLRAALDPLPNEYYYFLNNIKTGETVFSKTFEEHVANRQKHGL